MALENNLSDIIRPQIIGTFHPKFPLALVLGEEVKGISKSLLKLCDVALEIPMLGKKESLNVSVSFGIAAYEITKNMAK